MTHADIIVQAGDIAAVSRALNVPYERVAGWKRTRSIPGRYWMLFEVHGLASMTSLAASAPRVASAEQAA